MRPFRCKADDAGDQSCQLAKFCRTLDLCFLTSEWQSGKRKMGHSNWMVSRTWQSADRGPAGLKTSTASV